MSLISPNFAVKSIIFPILARGLFPKLLEKALLYCCSLSDKHGLSHGMYLYQVMVALHFLNDITNDNQHKNLKLRHNC